MEVYLAGSRYRNPYMWKTLLRLRIGFRPTAVHILEFLERFLEAAKLRLRGGAGALDLLVRFQHLLHDWREILHVEPEWDDDERRPDEKFEYAAEPCVSAHGVQHFIVLLRQANELVQFVAFVFDSHFPFQQSDY